MMKCQPHLLALFAVGILGCPSDDDDPPADTNGSTSSASSSSGGGMQNDTTDGGDTSTGTPQSDSSTDGGGSSTAAASTGTDESAGSSSDGGSSSGGSDESTGTTGAQGALPDLDMSIVGPDTQASISIQFQNFSENDCEVVEACVPAAGMRRLLRFSTITPNVGDADFHVGSPMSNPELFTFSACQGTDLFTDYAAYRLLDDEGNEVGTGHKSAFALIDLVPWAKDAGPAQYGFGAEMGISVGWSDVYDAGLPCQWVDITDVPAGDYTLELDINGDEVVLESDFTNNILQL
ncbi:MAG: lysyl oxidase family protein, partial [Myxococcota bacterium]